MTYANYEFRTYLPWVFLVLSIVVALVIGQRAKERANEAALFIVVLGILIWPVWNFLRPNLGLYGSRYDIVHTSKARSEAEILRMMAVILTPEAYLQAKDILNDPERRDIHFWGELANESYEYLESYSNHNLPSSTKLLPVTSRKQLIVMFEYLRIFLPGKVLASTEQGAQLETIFRTAMASPPITPAPIPTARPAKGMLLTPTAPRAVANTTIDLGSSNRLLHGTVKLLTNSVVLQHPDGTKEVIALASLSPNELAWLTNRLPNQVK